MINLSHFYTIGFSITCQELLKCTFDAYHYPYYNIDMNENSQIHEALQSFRLPAYHEIPDVGLYLDQVAKYMNSFLDEFPEMNVTPSMISNYAKQKLIDRVNKKRYTRDQIAMLLMIALTKTVISIDHVRVLIDDVNRTGTTTEEVYDRFRAVLHDVLSSFNGPQLSVELKTGTELEQMARNVIITIAHKMYLERYFENKAESDPEE